MSTPEKPTVSSAAGDSSAGADAVDSSGSGTPAASESPSSPQASHDPSTQLAGLTRRLSARALADLQRVLDAFPHYVMLVDDEHSICAANVAVTDALGVSPREIIGGFCPKVVHGVDGRYPGCPLEQARAKNEAVEIEHHDKSTDRIVRSGIYPTPYQTDEGRSVYLHSIYDITEQRRAEQRLQRKHEAQQLVNDLLHRSLRARTLEEVLDLVVERIAAIPWLSVQPRGVIFLADETGEKLVLKAHKGLEPVLQHQCAELSFGECVCGRAAATGQIQFASELGPEHDHGYEGMPAHGHYCVPIKDGDKVLGVLTTSVDEGHEKSESELEFLSAVADVLASVMKRHHVEALQRQHERIATSRERLARLGEMSAGVAHTVRNPLHGVLGCVEIFETQARRGEPASREVLSLMRDGLERIEKVTRRLLALTRDTELRRGPTRIDSLLGDVVDLMAVQAKKKQVELRLDVQYAGEALLNADRVVEGVSAVLSNALDACDPGDVVTVRSRLIAGPEPALLLEVADTGCGIEEEHVPRVLDPFFTTKPIGEGSGLGLAITRRVVDEHDGDIEVTSRVGQGTVVRLTFPGSLVRPEQPPAEGR